MDCVHQLSSVSFTGIAPTPPLFASGHVTSGNAGIPGGETIVDLET